MILVRSQGRLGNQLFLYSAVSESRRGNELLVVVGFLELKRLFTKLPGRVIWLPIPHAFDARVKRFFKLLAKANRRVCRCAREAGGDSRRLVRGRACAVPLVFEFGLCQSVEEAPLAPVLSLFSAVRDTLPWLDSARGLLDQLGLGARDYAFIHMRFGDYLDFSAHGLSPALPPSWYRSGFDELTIREGEIAIVVLSDDIERAKSYLPDRPNLHFVAVDEATSFGLMVMARHGVLSASTFSWWGSLLATATQDERRTFLAPNYWMGFRAKRWFPHEGIRSNHLTFLEVEPG